MLMTVIIASPALAYEMYVQKNPTNESSIVFGPLSLPSGCVKWRAYASCDNGSQGSNGWQGPASGWYYKDNISPSTTTVSWNLSGLQNQNCKVTYWLFYSNGTWEYGPQVTVVSDTVAPTGSISQPNNGVTLYSTNVALAALAQDERSGIEWLRIYLLRVSSGLTVAGWSRDSSGNLYHDFYAASINESITLPLGQYTLAIWVKDKAGNVAMEPGPRVSFTVSSAPPVEYCGNGTCGGSETCTSCPTDCGICPPVETCGNHYCAATETCKTCPTDCGVCPETCGNGICGTGETCTSCPGDCGICPPVETCGNGICGSSETCKTCASDCGACAPICGDSSCNGNETCGTCPQDCGQCPIQQGCDEQDGKYACSFRPLVGSENEIIYYLTDTSAMPSNAWTDYQRLFGIFAYPNKCHLGPDFNRRGGDKDEKIYAPANCTIINYDDTAESCAWGKWIILRCQANPNYPFYTPSGLAVYSVDIFIAHLGEIKIHTNTGDILPSQIKKNETKVKKGWQIATVGNANGYYGDAYHLHAEYRLFNSDTAGSGYMATDKINDIFSRYTDPVDFTNNNRKIEDSRNWLMAVPAGVNSTSNRAYGKIICGNWATNGRTDETGYTSVGKYDNYLSCSDANAKFEWHFKPPKKGQYQLSVIIPRSTGSTAQVRYQVNSEDQPKVWTSAIINQTVGESNARITLGQFNFNADTDYAVVMYREKTADTSLMTADALEALYQPNNGTGGGEDLTDPYNLAWLSQWVMQYPYDALPNPIPQLFNDAERGSVLAISGAVVQEHWHQQMFKPLSVSENETLTISGWVRGQGSGKIQTEVFAQDVLQLWQEFTITSTWQEFSATFTATKADDGTAAFIHFGNFGGTLYLSDISINTQSGSNDPPVGGVIPDDDAGVGSDVPATSPTNTTEPTTCNSCDSTSECTVAFGNGWGCVQGCCQKTDGETEPPKVVIEGCNMTNASGAANLLFIVMPLLALIFRKQLLR